MEGVQTTPSGRVRWTREHCDFLEQAGILPPRYELIDGEILLKMPQSREHARIVMFIIAYLVALFGPERVQTQATMEVREDDQPTNRPEPDVVLLSEDLTDTPEGNQVLLAIEVSLTTGEIDMGFKRDLYARAGVGEYWVVDVNSRTLVIFRNGESGRWQQRLELAETEPVAPLVVPDNPIHLADWLRSG